MSKPLKRSLQADAKKSGIYKITNLINGKVYIGKTSMSFIDRWKDYRLTKQSTRPVMRALRKYGLDSFTFEVLEVIADHSRLTEREQYWIDEFKSDKRNFGYNRADVTGGPGKHTEANKQKIREATTKAMRFRQDLLEWERGPMWLYKQQTNIDKVCKCIDKKLKRKSKRNKVSRKTINRLTSINQIKSRHSSYRPYQYNRWTWTIVYKNGNIETTRCLKEWCLKNGYSLCMMRKYFVRRTNKLKEHSSYSHIVSATKCLTKV